MFLTSLKQICNEYLIKFSENQSAPKLENRKTHSATLNKFIPAAMKRRRDDDGDNDGGDKDDNDTPDDGDDSYQDSDDGNVDDVLCQCRE